MLSTIFNNFFYTNSCSNSNLEYTSNEKKYSYYLNLKLPGFTREDISLTIENDILTIKGGINENNKSPFVFKFEKTFTLPSDIISKDISAKVDNGILFIKLPKIKKVKPVNINIT